MKYFNIIFFSVLLLISLTGCDDGKYDFLGNRIIKHSFNKKYDSSTKMIITIKIDDKKIVKTKYYENSNIIHSIKTSDIFEYENSKFKSIIKELYYTNGNLSSISKKIKNYNDNKIVVFNNSKYNSKIKNYNNILPKNESFYLKYYIKKFFHYFSKEYISKENLEMKKYDFNGNLKILKKVDQNNNVSIEKYYINGNLKSKYDLNYSNKKSKITSFYKNSNIKSVSFYLNNLQIGNHKTFYDSNISLIKYKSYYKNGILEKETIHYYIDGSIESINEIKNGKLNGISKTFYENGDIKTKRCFLKNKLIDCLKI